MEDSTIAAILNDIGKHLPKVPKKKLTRAKIAAKANLNVPSEYKNKYFDILYKLFSVKKTCAVPFPV
jgi:hypothetical protein